MVANCPLVKSSGDAAEVASDVADATPNVGVVNVGDVALTTAPVPVLAVAARPSIEKELPVPAVSKVLLVKVSVVARPTKVSVAVGSVSVPVFEIVPITGAVKVLFVRVSVVARPTRVSVASGSVRVLAVVKELAKTPVMPVVLPSTSKRRSLVSSTEPLTMEVVSTTGSVSPVGVATQVPSPRQ